MEVIASDKPRVGVLLSHPIQYFSPWFRDLATHVDLHVYYAYQQDASGQSSAGFGVEFEWDVPLLEGYPYTWLKNVAKRPGVKTFGGCDTPELFEIISPKRFDSFLVFGWNRKSSWQAIRTCWRSGVPLLMRGDSQLPSASSRLKRLLKSVPYRWFLPRIDGHLYVGQRNRDYLLHYGVPKSQLFHCPHFVDNEFFARRAQEAVDSGRDQELRRRHGIPSDAFVVLFVGKLISKKNPRDFIQAVVRAKGEGRPVHGLVVGSGPMENECRASVAGCERVHFAGFQNQTQLPAFYALSDALVLPSNEKETWGLVVNEAMACGTPCVVSDACGCGPDMIQNGANGFTFRLGDVEELGGAIQRLNALSARDPDTLARAISRTSAEHSIRKATDGLLEAVSRLRNHAESHLSGHCASS